MSSSTYKTCLWFDDDGLEAVEMYTELLPDAEILSVSHYPEDIEFGRPGALLQAQAQTIGLTLTFDFPDVARARYAADLAAHELGRPGAVMQVEFRLGDQQYVVLNGGPMFPHTEAVSVQVFVDSQEELDRVWDGLLAGGGEPSQCGWLTDRFGMSWQVIPSRLAELMSDPDPDVAGAVMAQLLQMSKLDLAPLEAAATRASGTPAPS